MASHVFVPTSTYRLQFNRNFTFDDARSLVDYFDDLGIGACYASPIFKARPGSEHGYDVVDHRQLNPEIGSDTSFARLAESLKKNNIGLILDVVPNHMCITESVNPWWNDVLENGPSSPYAGYFDIDWHPPKVDLANKILLPELGDQYGKALEDQKIALAFENGLFVARYETSRYPIAPRSWSLILGLMASELNSENANEPDMLEFESVRTAVDYLPLRTDTRPEKVRERYREKEVIRRRFAALLKTNVRFRKALDSALEKLNGSPGDPHSFDGLENLLNDQVYRLCYWRVAADEINYRRFFDINFLAAVRVEEADVFDAVHNLTLRLIADGHVNGLRIDHVDGLADPTGYLEELAQKSMIPVENGGASTPYIVVEKILMPNEKLREQWKIQGTTGYDFMNQLNGLFVDRRYIEKFFDLYRRFTGHSRSFKDVAFACKRVVMHVSLASELNVLASHLDRISEHHRWSRDFTFDSLRFALREVIACFPTYRSYYRKADDTIDDEDRRSIQTAVREAKERNPSMSESIFDFIESVLLRNDPQGLSASQISERQNFIIKFQQLTSPVTAKGVEDTAFYRYFPLASLNEVGGRPDLFGTSLDDFHRKNEERAKTWPHTMLATTTHDTKRSEDVRARINVLSEIPIKWYRAILQWQTTNKVHKMALNHGFAPDANEEYLFYQTLVGTWPMTYLNEKEWEKYCSRIENYMQKALKEAKVHSSWVNPHADYEKALSHFVRAALSPTHDNRFPKEFGEFHESIIESGLLNSLSQQVLKLTSPGIPDLYQGSEMWNFTLVDPDNRAAVDYKTPRKWLSDNRKKIETNPLGTMHELAASLKDGLIKLYVTNRLLNFRRREEQLMRDGAYYALKVRGDREKHVCAFARDLDNKRTITATGRFFQTLREENAPPRFPDTWQTTNIFVNKTFSPLGLFRDVFTGRVVQATLVDNEWVLRVSELFNPLPISFLEVTS